jgi:hypothetical protein
MAILLDEEKVVKIVKFNFLVKMKLLLEMALGDAYPLPTILFNALISASIGDPITLFLRFFNYFIRSRSKLLLIPFWLGSGLAVLERDNEFIAFFYSSWFFFNHFVPHSSLVAVAFDLQQKNIKING